MTHSIRFKYRAGGALAALLTALVIAACGSSASSSSSPSAAPSSAASSNSASSSGMLIGTVRGAAGTYLVGPSGHALYLWDADTAGRSNCAGACAQAWPPLIAHGAPRGTSGVAAGDLGTTMRADGARQVTYKGHPLYYFVADSSKTTTAGQGSDNFGAKWWLVGPSGSAVTAAASSGSSSASSSSSSSGGGRYGY